MINVDDLENITIDSNQLTSNILYAGIYVGINKKASS